MLKIPFNIYNLLQLLSLCIRYGDKLNITYRHFYHFYHFNKFPTRYGFLMYTP